MAAAFNESQGLFVLGRGPGLAIAQEAALKFKETCGIHAEAFSTAEVRHGPMALAATGLPMLIFRQDDESASGVDALIKELRSEEHTSELQSLMRISYAVFCLQKKTNDKDSTSLPNAHPVSHID